MAMQLSTIRIGDEILTVKHVHYDENGMVDRVILTDPDDHHAFAVDVDPPLIPTTTPNLTRFPLPDPEDAYRDA